jgi:hypothetical protein
MEGKGNTNKKKIIKLIIVRNEAKDYIIFTIDSDECNHVTISGCPHALRY